MTNNNNDAGTVAATKAVLLGIDAKCKIATERLRLAAAVARELSAELSYDSATDAERSAVIDELTGEAERLGMYVYGSKRLNELEKTAKEAATDDGWKPSGCLVYKLVQATHGVAERGVAHTESDVDASFIADWSPATALKLLACIRAADDMRACPGLVNMPSWVRAYDTARAALEEP